jgi:hypothetical protein
MWARDLHLFLVDMSPLPNHRPASLRAAAMKNPLTSRLLAISLFVSMSMVCATGRGEIIASNLGPPEAKNGQSILSLSASTSFVSLAQAFQTTVSTTVSTVSGNFSMNGSNSLLAIYSDSGLGFPGSPVPGGTVASGTYPLDSLNDFAVNVFSVNVPLTSGTYWVVLSGSSGFWGYNNLETGTGSGYLALNASQTVATSGTWALDPAAPYRLQIQVVPEPSTLALVVAPLAFGSWVVARRRAIPDGSGTRAV